MATDDRDLRYIEVRDAHGASVYVHGSSPGDAFDGASSMLHVDRGAIRVWMPITFEAIKLGDVAVVLDTRRVDGLRQWVRILACVVTIAWLAALAYSIIFARGFVSPIYAMMKFSRKVATGELAERLDIDAKGELHELVDYLNAMTAQLEQRQRERMDAAQRADELQRSLLVLTRKAGMAEVATGVLHDVGNVLNSLNVSVAVVEESVRTSKVAQLAKAVELCGSTAAGLTAFLATTQGTALPQFLTSVSQRLVEENTAVRSEIASVVSNVEHIKVIVAMQQALARVGGVVGSVSIPAVVDDAQQMSELALVRHGVTVVRDYVAVPEITSDRHKLLQIFVNLVSNALHALKEHPTRRLTIRIETRPAGVAIVVSDTGVGITAAHLERVFQHGFTTRSDGHGFGLHASANSAHALGGTITVASDGLGHGATFTVELPLEQHVGTN